MQILMGFHGVKYPIARSTAESRFNHLQNTTRLIQNDTDAMDINALQAFLAVADKQSFSLAADQLFLTQPAVSKRIAALEESLNTRLFDRLGKRIVLTEAGQILQPKAQHILQELEDSRRLIANLSHTVSGSLQLATSHHIGLHRLPGTLRDYALSFPQVELDIRFTGSETACDAVLNGELELAVITLPDVFADKLRLEPLWQDPLALMVAKQHPLRNSKNLLADLSNYPAVLPEQGTFTRDAIETPLALLGVELKIGLETNYLETIRMMVSVGLGWSVLPLTMKTKELHVIDVNNATFNRTLGIVSHKTRTLSRAAQEFCNMLRLQNKH